MKFIRDWRDDDGTRQYVNRPAEDVIAELFADVERLTRELREARSALLCYAPKCFTCNQLATRGRVEFSGRYCDAHADPIHHDHQHAPAIRAAEKDAP